MLRGNNKRTEAEHQPCYRNSHRAPYTLYPPTLLAPKSLPCIFQVFFGLVFGFFAFLQSFATTNIFIYKYLLYLCNISFPLNIAFKVSFSGSCRMHLFLIAVPQGIHFLIDGHLVVFVLPVSSSADLYILVHIS